MPDKAFTHSYFSAERMASSAIRFAGRSSTKRILTLGHWSSDIKPPHSKICLKKSKSIRSEGAELSRPGRNSAEKSVIKENSGAQENRRKECDFLGLHGIG